MKIVIMALMLLGLIGQAVAYEVEGNPEKLRL